MKFTEQKHEASNYTFDQMAEGCLYGLKSYGAGWCNIPSASGSCHGWQLTKVQTYGTGNQGIIIPLPVSEEAKLVHRVACEAWIRALIQREGGLMPFCKWLANNKIATPPGFGSVAIDIIRFYSEADNRFEPSGGYHLSAHFKDDGLEHLAEYYGIVVLEEEEDDEEQCVALSSESRRY